MALVRYNPFRGFDALSKRMSDVLGDFGSDPFTEDYGFDKPTFYPSVDVKEDDKSYFIKAELPGLNKEDVKVTVNDDNVLQIRGEKKKEQKDKGENYIRMERGYGEFTRSFALPDNVKDDKIKAIYNDGVLEITLEKVEPSKPKEKEVKID